MNRGLIKLLQATPIPLIYSLVLFDSVPACFAYSLPCFKDV
jgi:hypothetical protein